jgi:hypothetical protein
MYLRRFSIEQLAGSLNALHIMHKLSGKRQMLFFMGADSNSSIWTFRLTGIGFGRPQEIQTKV